jgi:hypothetical protein
MMDSSSRTCCRRAARPAAARCVLCAALLTPMSGACSSRPPRPALVPEPDPIGIFEGSIRHQNGEEIAYRAILAPDPAAPGRHIGTIDIPMQALREASLEGIVFEAGRRVEFSLGRPGTPRWTGVVAADGAMTCEFRQGAVRLLCSMNDVSAARNSAPLRVGEDP